MYFLKYEYQNFVFYEHFYRPSVRKDFDQAFTANWLHLTALDCTTYIFQSAPKSIEIRYLALFTDLFDSKPDHIWHATLNPPCCHIPIFITFSDSILLSTTLGGHGGSVITKTKHLLNSWGDGEKKKSTLFGILVPNPSFSKKSRHKKSSHHDTLQQLFRAEMCSLWPFCQHSFILRTRRHLCHSVWAASQHYGNFKAPCHHLNARYSSLPREDFAPASDKEREEDESEDREGHNLCQDTWKNRSGSLARRILHRNVQKLKKKV